MNSVIGARNSPSLWERDNKASWLAKSGAMRFCKNPECRCRNSSQQSSSTLLQATKTAAKSVWMQRLDYHLWIHATCWCLCIECAPVWQARWWNEFSSHSIIWTCGFGISCWWGFKLKSFISRFLCFSYGLLIFITFCNLVVVPTCGECGCLLWWMQRNLQVLSFFYTR